MAAHRRLRTMRNIAEAWAQGALALDPMTAAAAAQAGIPAPGATDVAVLIVGAGPTGLTAAAVLAQLGVPTLTVERHPGTTNLPRAIGVNVRSMEVFRSLGVSERVRAAGFEGQTSVAQSRTLADPERTIMPFLNAPGSEVSPEVWTTCSQQEIEPILLAEVLRHRHAQVRFNTELLSLQPAHDGARACLEDRITGRRSEVRCRYVVAADGARSAIRESLGIRLEGPGELGHMFNIHFTAPLRQRLPYTPYFLHRVENDRARGIFIAVDGAMRWVMAVGYNPANGESPEDFTDARAAELIRAGSGIADLPVEITGRNPWTAQADVATRWRAGSVFLAGDAAHRMTPAGGLGMNTGIQDAHNLAWKLAAVLHGRAGSGLLDTYETERRPVAQANALRSAVLMANGPLKVTMATAGPAGATRTPRDYDLGFAYASDAVVSDGTQAPARADGDYVPSARPGSRLPHLWVTSAGRRVSTLDLIGGGFTLLVQNSAGAWKPAARSAGHQVGTTVRIVSVHPRGAAEWSDVMGVTSQGAILVRPDGHVAWRSAELPHEPGRVLAAALAQVTSVPLADRTAAGSQLAAA